MLIRPATANDVEAVRACAEGAYQIYVEAIGRKPMPMIVDFGASQRDGHLYVAELDGQVVGFAVVFQRDDHIFLENVAVSPAHQGKGVGGKLMKFVEQQATESGLNKIELYTNIKMTGNLTWYPSLGFEEIGRWSEDGFDRVFYRKQL